MNQDQSAASDTIDQYKSDGETLVYDVENPDAWIAASENDSIEVRR